MHDGNHKELKILVGLVAAFLALYYLPIESARFQGAIVEAFRLAKWYAREHVLLCLIPAFFIAGAIGVFVSQGAVMKYFGPRANKLLAYGVASVSGTILAVCSCTVLPLFGSIYMRGAGLGPAIAFLYSGPAINVLAIVLTARVLGSPLGIARAIGAVLFSIVIGGLMHLLFLREEQARAAEDGPTVYIEPDDKPARPLWQTALYFLSMAAILVFANWGRPATAAGPWQAVYAAKWWITAGFAVLLAFTLWRFLGVSLLHLALSAGAIAVAATVFRGHPVAPFTTGAVALSVLTFLNGRELKEWRDQTWGFGKQIAPLLVGGVLAAGFFLGSPESPDAGVVPNRWIQALVGDAPNVFWDHAGRGTAVPAWLSLLWPVWTCLFASLTGALMYFATLTEVPILRGLMDSGMGQGPALSLLLAGPALSLPSMLVIHSIIGLKKTMAYVSLVVVMSTITGIVYGTVMR